MLNNGPDLRTRLGVCQRQGPFFVVLRPHCGPEIAHGDRKDSVTVVQAWFQGMTPRLDDVAPARLLPEGDLEEVGPEVLAAARACAAAGRPPATEAPQVVVTAADQVWRVGFTPEPWAWSGWEWAGADGRFHDRWDDRQSNFRTIYAQSAPSGRILDLRANTPIDISAGQTRWARAKRRIRRGASSGTRRRYYAGLRMFALDCE